MYDRKSMFGDKIWFKLEWSKHAQKRSTRKIFFCTLNKGQLPTLLMQKSCTPFLRELWNETYTFYHLCTLFNLKNLSAF